MSPTPPTGPQAWRRRLTNAARALRRALRPLHAEHHLAYRAINDHNLDALRRALATESADTTVDGQGTTLLHLAIEVCPAAVIVLLEHGANPLAVNTHGQSPTDWAQDPAFTVMPSVQQALATAVRHRQVQDETAALHAVLNEVTGPSGSGPTQTPVRPRSRL